MMWTSIILIANNLALSYCLIIALQFSNRALLKLCWLFDTLMLLNARWQFDDILLLSSSNRISSFYWIRGSKHCFLTSFSNLNRYFCFLVFLHNCYLLVSLGLSWLHGNTIPHPVFYTFILWVPRCTCAPIFLAHLTHFLKAGCSWEPGTRISTNFFPRSIFCRRFLMRMSIGQSRIIPFLLTQNSSNWHFLVWHKPPLSQRSTARARNPQGISNLVNKGWLLLVWQQLLDNFPSTLCTCSLSSGFLALHSIW